MRYSTAKRFPYKDLTEEVKDNAAFFDRIEKVLPAERRRCGILLAGGRDFRSLAVRRAQAAVRFDQRPSFWAHAALVLDWDERKTARGLEVAYRPDDPHLQVPERNGVTPFALAKFESASYVNLAFIALGSPKKGQEKKLAQMRSEIDSRARTPNAERVRYPLLEWLGTWSRYVTQPLRLPNPLLEGVAEPSAAFCEYAYEAAGIDLTPGATGPNGCPELLWSAALYWYDRVTSRLGDAEVFAVHRDRDAVPVGRALDHRIEL